MTYLQAQVKIVPHTIVESKSLHHGGHYSLRDLRHDHLNSTKVAVICTTNNTGVYNIALLGIFIQIKNISYFIKEKTEYKVLEKIQFLEEKKNNMIIGY